MLLFNKMDLVVHNTLVKLMESVKASGWRYIKRQGHNKDKNNVDDILVTLHKCNTNMLPTFYARNLTWIPTVDVNSVDLSYIVKECSEIRKQIIQIQTKMSHVKEQPTHKNAWPSSVHAVQSVRCNAGIITTLGIHLHLRIPGLPNRTTRRVTVVQLLLLQPRSRPQVK